MKHGVILLALTCWSAGAIFAADSSIPASTGMPGGGLTALTPDELSAIEGGDLFLAVDRDKQMMTVTRITPGNYDNIECYSVKVTTSVTRNSDAAKGVAKGSMENTERKLTSGDSALVPAGEKRTPTQFPAGTANLSPSVGTQTNVTGPVIRTDASQQVGVTGNKDSKTTVTDTGYNIHYVDPAKATNTWGCIGVQSEAGMAKVVNSLKADNASYPAGATPVQTVTVSAYTNGKVPAASTFTATEVKTVSKPAPAPTPAPAPAPAPVAAKPASPSTSTSSSSSSSSSSKPWWRFW